MTVLNLSVGTCGLNPGLPSLWIIYFTEDSSTLSCCAEHVAELVWSIVVQIDEILTEFLSSFWEI